MTKSGELNTQHADIRRADVMRPIRRYQLVLLIVIAATIVWILFDLEYSGSAVIHNIYNAINVVEERNTFVEEDKLEENIVEVHPKKRHKPKEKRNHIDNVQLLQFRPFTLSDCNEKTEGVDFWREVLSTQNSRLFVFSAYYDGRPVEPLVRIVAVGTCYRQTPVECLFKKGSSTEHFVRVGADIRLQTDNLYYCAGKIECRVPESIPRPKSVSIVEGNAIPTMLPVHDRSPSHNCLKGDFALCVKPLYKMYDRSIKLVEFFELHRILGVDHFYLYNHSIGANIHRVLEHYQHQGLVTVFPFHLDILKGEKIVNQGKQAVLTDCIYRSMFRYNYTIIVDFDEYIVPSKVASYVELVNRIREHNTGAMIFKNVFFNSYWADDNHLTNYVNNALALFNIGYSALPRLVTLSQTTRMHKASAPLDGSKYIAIPEALIEPGNNKPEEYWPGYKSFHVMPNIGLLHHYRTCTPGGEACVNHPHVTDRSTWKYTQRLVPGVINACAAIFPELNRCL